MSSAQAGPKEFRLKIVKLSPSFDILSKYELLNWDNLVKYTAVNIVFKTLRH